MFLNSRISERKFSIQYLPRKERGKYLPIFFEFLKNTLNWHHSSLNISKARNKNIFAARYAGPFMSLGPWTKKSSHPFIVATFCIIKFRCIEMCFEWKLACIARRRLHWSATKLDPGKMKTKSRFCYKCSSLLHLRSRKCMFRPIMIWAQWTQPFYDEIANNSLRNRFHGCEAQTHAKNQHCILLS